MIQKLHHAAYRCRDSEETRQFYEDFLGLPLTHAFEITTTATGNQAQVLHTFYALEDGSSLAFFEAPEQPFDFKIQHDFDLHIALEVSRDVLFERFESGRRMGIETRGITDHGFIESIYFRDPNGYVLELAAKTTQVFASESSARDALNAWQASKLD
mgnify:FL=1